MLIFRQFFLIYASPVSFCPTTTPNFRQDPSLLQPSLMSHRRFSELPIQLDMGLCFGEDVSSALARRCHYSSPDLCGAPQDSCLWSCHRGSSFVSRQSTDRAICSMDDSSCTSSAFTAPTSPVVESDGVSSICDHTVNAFDFPEPPPIGSPVIRRMQSSPWFLTADEADDVLAMPSWRGRTRPATLNNLKHFSRTSPPRPWAAKALELQGGSRSSLAPAKSADLGGYSRRCYPLGFPESQTTLGIHDRSQTSQTFLDNGGLGLSSRRNSTLVDFRGVSAVVSQTQASVSRNVGDKTEAQNNPSAFGRLPRIIRKVASMRSETQRAPDLMPGTIQRPVPNIRSFRSLLRASEEQTPTRAYPKWESWHLNKEHGSRPGQKASEVSRAKRQSIYRNPLPGESNFYASNASSRTLAPFSTCPAGWKNDLNKSFIDISPERGARSKNKARVGKGKMKSLFSKASQIFSWGRFQRKAAARGEQNP